MQRRGITAWMFVHKWSSLVCTAFLLMLCVTGLPLIFHQEIDDALSPPVPLRAVAPGAPLMSLDALVARAVAAHRGEVPLYLSFEEERPVVNITTAPRADSPVAQMHFDSLDARTGEPLPPHGSPLMTLLLSIHTDLTLGLGAELFLGAMGLLFFVAIVSGVVIYLPFMARLPFGAVRHERGVRVRRLDRHNLLGMVTLAWATVVGLTGVVNTLALPITALWKADQLAAVGGGAGPVVRSTVSLDRAMTDALRVAPGMKPQFIAFPGVAYSSNRHVALFLQGTSPFTRRLLTPVFVDGRSGHVDLVGRVPWYMKALLLAEPLHFGDYGGLPLKLVWAVLDLLTIAVLWTGLRLWMARRHTPRARGTTAEPNPFLFAMEDA